jgi:hypothetical protein
MTGSGTDRAATRWWSLLAFLGAATLYAYPYWIYRQWDLPAHIDSLEKMVRGELVLPHFLFHLLTWMAQKLTALGLQWSGLAVEILSQGVAGVYAFKLLARRTDDRRVAVLLALLCLTLGPISIFTYPKLYLGYAGMNVAHNPTVSMLKPIAFATIYFLERYFETSRLDTREKATFIGLFLLGLLAKPSFHESLVLVVTSVVGWQVARGRLPRAHIIFWLGMSALILATLAVQAKVTFSESHKIALCFMCVYSHYAGSVLLAAIFLALSISVPVFGARLIWQQSPVLAVVVLAHIAGTLSISLFVAEAGPRFAAGNFLWHSQLPLLVGNLLVVRALWQTGRDKWLWSLVALEAVSGVFFLYGLQHRPWFGFLNLFSMPPELRVAF